jgi:hypothetical protein
MYIITLNGNDGRQFNPYKNALTLRKYVVKLQKNKYQIKIFILYWKIPYFY